MTSSHFGATSRSSCCLLSATKTLNPERHYCNYSSTSTYSTLFMGSDDDDEPLGSGLGSILKFTGTNVPARARFIGEAFVSATLFSVTMGLCCGVVGATVFPMTCGPLVPFLAGSSVGYSFGLWEHWSSCKRNMIFYSRHYPRLLAHALWTEHKLIVPRSVMQASQEQLKQMEEDGGEGAATSSMRRNPTISYEPNKSGIPLDQWVFQGGLARMTWSILAAQQCRPDVIAIEEKKREQLVESILQEGGEDEE